MVYTLAKGEWSGLATATAAAAVRLSGGAALA